MEKKQIVRVLSANGMSRALVPVPATPKAIVGAILSCCCKQE